MKYAYSWSAEQLSVCLRALWPVLARSGAMIYLKGSLGAGKTTCLRIMLDSIGYEGLVQSPSYGLMHVYDTNPPIVHCDLYRFDHFDAPELLMLDQYEGDAIYCVEWAERAQPGCLPEPNLTIEIDFVHDLCQIRLYTFSIHSGPHQAALNAALMCVNA